MKKGKKALIATVVFAAALNLNGCVYGPPPEHDDDRASKAEETTEVQSETDVAEDSDAK